MLWRPFPGAGVMHSSRWHHPVPVLGVQVALGCSWEWRLEMEERVCADCPAWSRAGWKFSITLTLHERCDPTV